MAHRMSCVSDDVCSGPKLPKARGLTKKKAGGIRGSSVARWRVPGPATLSSYAGHASDLQSCVDILLILML